MQNKTNKNVTGQGKDLLRKDSQCNSNSRRIIRRWRQQNIWSYWNLSQLQRRKLITERIGRWLWFCNKAGNCNRWKNMGQYYVYAVFWKKKLLLLEKVAESNCWWCRWRCRCKWIQFSPTKSYKHHRVSVMIGQLMLIWRLQTLRSVFMAQPFQLLRMWGEDRLCKSLNVKQMWGKRLETYHCENFYLNYDGQFGLDIYIYLFLALYYY